VEAVDHFAVLMNTTWLYECTNDFLFQHDMLNVHVLSNIKLSNVISSGLADLNQADFIILITDLNRD